MTLSPTTRLVAQAFEFANPIGQPMGLTLADLLEGMRGDWADDAERKTFLADLEVGNEPRIFGFVGCSYGYKIAEGA